MTSRPRIHLDVHLPELSPTQADFFSKVLSDLSAAIWDAYADDLLTLERQRSQHLLDPEEEWPDSEEDHAPTSPNTDEQEPDPDL